MATSPISPVSLPRPYDISAAVQQALKLNSSSDSDDVCPAAYAKCTAKALDKEIKRSPSSSEEDIDELSIPDLVTEDLLDEVWDNVTLPEDMDTDAWGENNTTNMQELERFCRYIDGDVEEDIMHEKASTTTSRNKTSCDQQLLMHPTSAEYIHVELVDADLWRRFSEIGTEMVITKSGRRMFPAIAVSIYGLNPDAMYSMYLDILPADDCRYKFMQTEWVPVGKVDKKYTYREYTHPDSPNTGKHWMEKPVIYKYLKLTNNKSTIHSDQIILNSMQKYQPVIRIKMHSNVNGPESRTFQYPETRFIAVTAYQNSRITQLKIENNPYARAFRDSISTETTESEKRGGHFKQHPISPTPSPPHCLSLRRINTKSEGSATSIESGFESGSSSSEILYPRMQWMSPFQNPIHQSENPYGCPFNYWADENSLYHSALIYPPPLLDSASSFTEPYLHQSSQMVLESQTPVVSPIKPCNQGSNTVIIELSYNEVEDDVFT